MKQAHRFLVVYTVVFVLFFGARSAVAQNEAFEASESIPPGVHTVMSDGFWTHGDDEGFFRVVVIAGGVEHVSHRLYIQWLRSDPKTQGYELVRTVNVRELNLGQGFVLQLKTSFGDINAFKINVAANSRGGEAKRFAITVSGDGKYLIRLL